MQKRQKTGYAGTAYPVFHFTGTAAARTEYPTFTYITTCTRKKDSAILHYKIYKLQNSQLARHLGQKQKNDSKKKDATYKMKV